MGCFLINFDVWLNIYLCRCVLRQKGVRASAYATLAVAFLHFYGFKIACLSEGNSFLYRGFPLLLFEPNLQLKYKNVLLVLLNYTAAIIFLC